VVRLDQAKGELVSVKASEGCLGCVVTGPPRVCRSRGQRMTLQLRHVASVSHFFGARSSSRVVRTLRYGADPLR
jgi:hypothetical protein